MFKVDPLQYDKECDGKLPLDDILKPNDQLIKLLKDIDPSKARVCSFKFKDFDVLHVVMK